MMLKTILPLAVLSVALGATVAGAQSAALATASETPVVASAPDLAPVATQTATSNAGPRIEQARAGFAVAQPAMSPATDPVPQPPITRKRGVPQMIIGGAAILGGAIVGGDGGALVSLAGLGYGLYGLYIYLQ
jgi:hypothetical protein